MALPTNLTNNEVKDRASAAVSFLRRSNGPGPQVEFAKTSEVPARPHRISVRHQDIGTGVTQRRRSALQVRLTFPGHVDSVKYATVLATLTLDIPIGNMTTTNEAKDVLANLGQICFTQGAAESCTRLDGSGIGASAILNGEL
jgi:hypothetical protein